MNSTAMNAATSCWFPLTQQKYDQFKDKDGWVLGYWEKWNQYFVCRQEEPLWWRTDKSKDSGGYMGTDPDHIAAIYPPYTQEKEAE